VAPVSESTDQKIVCQVPWRGQCALRRKA
jgi:hypothetical protein